MCNASLNSRAIRTYNPGVIFNVVMVVAVLRYEHIVLSLGFCECERARFHLQLAIRQTGVHTMASSWHTDDV
jgi:hypothetical protein